MSRKSAAFHLNSNGMNFLDFETKYAEARSETPPPKGKKPAAEPRPRKVKESEAYHNEYDDGESECIVPMHEVVKPSAGKKVPLKSVQEHQLLINTLHALGASPRFAPVLDRYGIKLNNLHDKSIAELKDLRERARACCANVGGGGGSVIYTGVIKTAGGMEYACPKKFMDLSGYTAALEQDEELAALCELIEIDSGFKSSMTPLQRLGFCMATNAFNVASRNKVKSVAVNANSSLLESLKAQQAAQKAQSEPKPASAAAPAAEPVAPQKRPFGADIIYY